MAQTFKIQRIAAHSDNPIRNSAGELIFGNHVLWEGDKWDGDKGSLEPNVSSYDFSSTPGSSVTVTIKFTGAAGAEYRLRGLIHGYTILESDFFAIGSTGEATVLVKVIDPHSSPNPFSWNADFEWELEQKDSTNKITSPDKTRLELYWISANVHEIFLHSGIPIDLLRTAIPSSTPHPARGPQTRDPAQNVWATQVAFGSYSKTYDTISGAPHFGVSGGGGTFRYNYYVAAAAGGPAGSLQPIVNCYDQAAMVQVLSTVGSVRASWLYQQPYGYINPTNLIGVGQCNNPFYRSNGTTPMIGFQDTRRTGFGNHAYNGELTTFSPTGDRIYDACAGPHLGTETPQQYVSASIDTLTNLYSVTGTRPGTVADVRQYPGVTAISPTLLRAAAEPEHVKKLVENSTFKNAKPHSQAHWDDVGKWIKTVLGGRVEVAYQETNVGASDVDVLAHLTGVSEVDDGNLVLRARVETRVGSDGKLDIKESSDAINTYFATEIKNTELDLGPNYEDIDKLWIPAHLEDYADSSIQYAADVRQGRILVVSGNTLVDIRGGTSSAALDKLARSLLKHTTIDTPSVHVPKLTRHSVDIPEASRGGPLDSGNVVVRGVGVKFDIKCHIEGLVSNVGAYVEDFGLLLSRVSIDRNTGNNTSAVIFRFVTRTLGTHKVYLRFAEKESLVILTETVPVKVVLGE